MTVPTNLAVTTADAVKAACVQVLQDSADLQALGIQVDYGPPTESRPPEGLYLGDIRWDDTDWESLGSPVVDPREERYNIEVIIGARTDGLDQKAATTRGFEILRIVNRELLGAQIVPLPGWLIVKPARAVEGEVDKARAANVNAVIYVYAYLP